MTKKVTTIFGICLLALSLPALERSGFAADVETAGNLEVQGSVRAGGGITFPDNSTQTSACSGCANGILSLGLGGTGASDALGARSNLDVPGLYVPNTFTAENTFTENQTIDANVILTGNLYLPATSSAAGTIFSGTSTLLHTFGNFNFFAGINAGNRVMTGSNNTATGSFALSSNTSGEANTATGHGALRNNTTGSSNTANGALSLYDNTTGNYNTSSGYFALRYNSSGNNNTAGGYLALFANTTAGKNTAIGASALRMQSFSNNDSAWDTHNTAVGYEALYANQPDGLFNGMRNSAMGSGSLRSNTTGRYNTACGADALRTNTTGQYNTANGSNALFSNENGILNTASGKDALYSNTYGGYNSATGVSALFSNSTGSFNTAIGYYALQANTTGTYNTAIGYYAGDVRSTGNHCTFLGANSDAATNGLDNATAIGYGAVVYGSNHMRIGNEDVTQIGGQVAWSNLSDRRTKNDIRDLPLGLELIRKLKPVQFTMKVGNGRQDMGFIAQDVEALVGTDYNVLGIGNDPDRTLSLRYTDFIAPMVKAIQEQQAIIDRQGGMIDTLKREVDELKRLMGR